MTNKHFQSINMDGLLTYHSQKSINLVICKKVTIQYFVHKIPKSLNCSLTQSMPQINKSILKQTNNSINQSNNVKI